MLGIFNLVMCKTGNLHTLSKSLHFLRFDQVCNAHKMQTYGLVLLRGNLYRLCVLVQVLIINSFLIYTSSLAAGCTTVKGKN